MKNMKGQTETVVTIAILIVSAVIGLSILNSMDATKGTHFSAALNDRNLSGSGTTLSPIGYNIISAASVIVINSTDGSTMGAALYNLNITTGVINATRDDYGGDVLKNITWAYYSSDGYSSSLSRTIASYMVPLGLLGMLALALLFFRRT